MKQDVIDPGRACQLTGAFPRAEVLLPSAGPQVVGQDGGGTIGLMLSNAPRGLLAALWVCFSVPLFLVLLIAGGISKRGGSWGGGHQVLWCEDSRPIDGGPQDTDGGWRTATAVGVNDGAQGAGWGWGGDGVKVLHSKT